MSTSAHYHVRDIDIDLAEMPVDLYNEIISLHGQIDPPPAPPIFTCLGNRKPMYVYRHERGRYYLRHYPNETCGHSHLLSRMSDEHRRQAEYCLRAADSNGLQAELEVSTGGGTRVDVGVVFDTTTTGFEIQRSELSRAAAKQRAAKSFSAGWPTAWVHDKERDPDWAGHVPTARLTVRDEWSTRLPSPNTANVVIREFWRERSHGKWRYESGPKTVTLDELSYLMPLGEIIPVTVGKKRTVVLAPKEAAEIIDSCTFPGASQWRPVRATPRYRETAQRRSIPCKHPVSLDIAEPLDPPPQEESTIAEPFEYEGGVIPPKAMMPPPRNCPGCDIMHLIKPCYAGCHG